MCRWLEAALAFGPREMRLCGIGTWDEGMVWRAWSVLAATLAP